jgi:uncharacterized membrane protein YhaH (DUF805 family)
MSTTSHKAQNGSSRTKTSAVNQSRPPHSSNSLINHDIVFLFIPNIIGYMRVLLAASSLYFMRWHPKYCTWLYIISCLLDAFDGMAARRFGQSMFPITIYFIILSLIFFPYSNQVRSCSRYGNRSMYYRLFALLSLFRVSGVYGILSGSYFC